MKIQLRAYSATYFEKVNHYFPKKEIDRYTNRGYYFLLSLLGIYKSFFHLLINEDNLLGCGVIRWKYSKETHCFGWWLYGIWINPDYRGQRLGIVLMENLFNKLREKHIKRVYLIVRINNVVAINLYNKLGFVTIKENDTYKVMQYEL